MEKAVLSNSKDDTMEEIDHYRNRSKSFRETVKEWLLREENPEILSEVKITIGGIQKKDGTLYINSISHDKPMNFKALRTIIDSVESSLEKYNNNINANETQDEEEIKPEKESCNLQR